jgi:hypothetical protein
LVHSVQLQLLEASQQLRLFYGVGLSTHPKPGGPGIHFCLDHHFDLSGMGDTTSSYATASIALRIIRQSRDISEGLLHSMVHQISKPYETRKAKL